MSKGELRKNDFKWLNVIRSATDSPAPSYYPGVPLANVPASVARRLRTRRGVLIEKFFPKNPAHKTRWKITNKGRRALAEHPEDREEPMTEENLCVACDEPLVDGEIVTLEGADDLSGNVHLVCGLEAHLREIKRGRGPFKTRPLDHATVTIANMKSHADEAISLLYELEREARAWTTIWSVSEGPYRTNRSPRRSKMVGVDRIARERRRQVEVEGWTPEHDDGHTDGILALAGAAMAVESTGPEGHVRSDLFGAHPWVGDLVDKHHGDPIRCLEVAGALIAAEMDRLERMEKMRSAGEALMASDLPDRGDPR